MKEIYKEKIQNQLLLLFSSILILFILLNILYYTRTTGSITSPAKTTYTQSIFSTPSITSLSTLKVSNSVIDVGQISIANSIVVGSFGTPYYGEWKVSGHNSTFGIVTDTFNVTRSGFFVYSLNPTGNLLYIYTSGNVYSVNTITDTVVNTISGLPTEDAGFTVNPLYNIAYAQSFNPANILVVNLATDEVVNSIKNLQGNSQIIFSPLGTYAYAFSNHPGSLESINVAGNVISNTISGLGDIYSIAFNPSSTLAYAAGDSYIYVINTTTNTVANTIPLSGVGYLDMNPQGSQLYASGNYSIKIINPITNTVVDSISFPTVAVPDFAFNPSGSIFMVGLGYEVQVFNSFTHTLIGNITQVGSNNGASLTSFGTSNIIGYVGNNNHGSIYTVKFPEVTALQELNSTQTNNGLMQLIINATSTNTIKFTFNGKSYNQNTTQNGTIFGIWNVTGSALDAGVSNVLVLSNTITINPILTTPTLITSNALVASNPYVTFYANVSGGTVPYTYNFSIYNSATHIVVANMLTTSNTFSWHDTENTGNTLIANVSITDSATTPVTVKSPSLKNPSITVPTSVIDTGQYLVFTANDTGGTLPYIYNFSIYNSATHIVVANMLTTSNTFSWHVVGNTGNTILAKVYVTDSAGLTLNATLVSPVTVNPALGIPTITASNTIADYGEYERFTAYDTGGSPPYTYNFNIYYNEFINSANTSVLIYSNTVTTPTNSILWQINSFLPQITPKYGVITAYVNVTDNALMTQNSIFTPNITLLTVFPIHPINVTNMTSSLCAGAPGYGNYEDPGLVAGAIFLASNHVPACFRQDILVDNPTMEGVDANLSNRFGQKFLGILDYVGVDSYLVNKYGCAYMTCNVSDNNAMNNWTLADWNQTVANAIVEYPNIHWWEIWNEPDNYLTGYQNHSALNYFRMIKAAATIIHAARPNDTVVCMGGDGGGGVLPNSTALAWWQQVWNYGAAPYCNAVSVHYDYEATAESFNAIWNLTHVPIWESEIGVSDANYTQYIDYMLTDFNIAFSLSPHFKKLNWLGSCCGGFANWDLIQNYPIEWTPLLRAFAGFEDNNKIYTKSTLQMQAGQTIPFTIYATGGDSPYTYNFLIYNSATNVIVANQFGSSNTFDYLIPNTLEGDSIMANVFVTDGNNYVMNSSNSDIIDVANTVTCGALCTPTINIPQNQIVYGLSNIITATPNPYTDTISILVNGTVVASGSGTIYYNANTLTVGNHKIYAVDLTNGQESASNVITVNDTLTISAPFPSLQSVTRGNATSGAAPVIIDTGAIGGTPPYTYQLLEKAPGASSYTTVPGFCGNNSCTMYLSYTLHTNTTDTPAGVYSFEVEVTDSNHLSTISLPANIIVGTITSSEGSNNGGSTITEGGGGGGGGSGSGSTGAGGGLPHPIVTPTSYGYIVSNFGVPASFTFNFCNQQIYSILNFISPDAAGISLNNVPYTLSLGAAPTNLTGLVGCSMQLYNVSYIPLQQTVQIKFFGKNNLTNTITSNNNGSSGNQRITKNSTISANNTVLQTINITIISPSSNNVTLSTKVLNTTLNISKSQPTTIYVDKKDISISLTSTRKTQASIKFSIPSSISYTKPKNYSIVISIFNFTIKSNSSSTLSQRINVSYSCNVPSNTIKPFILKNTSWYLITNFTTNSQKCSISFNAPSDPLIGIFSSYSNKTKVTNNSLKTTIISQTTQQVTTESASISQNNTTKATQSENYSMVIYILVIVFVIIIFYLLFKIKRKPENNSINGNDISNQKLPVVESNEQPPSNEQYPTDEQPQSNEQPPSSEQSSSNEKPPST